MGWAGFERSLCYRDWNWNHFEDRMALPREIIERRKLQYNSDGTSV
jgi:hypothetical protein